MITVDTDAKNARYDAVPDSLVLNNTIQIQYSSDNADATAVDIVDWGNFDDILTTPLIAKAQAPADVNYTLNVWFTVSGG